MAMICPCCKSTNVLQEYGRIIISEVGNIFLCGDCNFLFIFHDGKFIRPVKDELRPYICPLCRKAKPDIVNIRVLVPRVGLECKACKKILCIWEGSAPTDEFANSSFQPGEWIGGIQIYTDPLKEAVQSALVSVFLDAIPVELNAAVEVISAQLENCGLLSKIKINRIKRAKAEAEKKPKKPVAKKQKKSEKKKSKKKKENIKTKVKTKARNKDEGSSKTSNDGDDCKDS